MKILYRLSNKDIHFDSAGLGLGNFDGIHLGHSKIIDTLKQECDKRNIQSIVYTFRRHPDSILNKDYNTPIIISNEQKISILEQKNIGCVFFEEFEEEYSRLTPEEFIKQIIVGEFNAKLLVVGYDYTFGIKGEGKANDLIEYGNKYNFEVIVVPKITVENTTVSSTLLRAIIKEGDMSSFYNMTNRYYSIPGEVSVGRQIGSEVGFPTANILPKAGFAIPSIGVYATKTIIEGQTYNSITNIGSNPTFGGQYVTIETHIFDFDKRLYGQNIEVFFYKKIRGEKVFKGIEEFKERLAIDIEETKDFFKTH